MPKRKATPRAGHSPWHTKYPPLSSTECTASPQYTEIDILFTDPCTLTNEQISHQQTIVSHKLHYATKVVTRALKVGRGFERQRLSRRLKATKEGVDDAPLKRVERELALLKEVDLEGVARGAVRRGLGKGVKGSVFFPVEETMEGPGERKNEKPGMGKNEVERAKSDLVAVLCNMKPVREAVKVAVEVVRGVALSKWVPGKEDRIGETVVGRRVEVKAGEVEDRDEAEEDAEWSEWSGIQDTTSSASLTLPIGEDSHRLSKTSAQPTKIDISLIDPSRHADEEWSGEEDEDRDEELQSSDGDGPEAGAERKIPGDELIANLETIITPSTGSDLSEVGPASENGEDDNSRFPSKEALTTEPKPAAPTSTTNSAFKISSSSSPPPAPATKKISSTTTTRTSTARDTFLPSLMSGYISGSDSGGEMRHGRGPAQKKQRKNRMGQQARRALAQKIYKENAKHLKLGLGPARLPGSVTREDRAGGRGGRGGGGGGARDWGDRSTGGYGAGAGQIPDRRKDNANEGGPLHPSWEASRKAKQTAATVQFQGTKIKFE